MYRKLKPTSEATLDQGTRGFLGQTEPAEWLIFLRDMEKQKIPGLHAVI